MYVMFYWSLGPKEKVCGVVDYNYFNYNLNL